MGDLSKAVSCTTKPVLTQLFFGDKNTLNQFLLLLDVPSAQEIELNGADKELTVVNVLNHKYNRVGTKVIK